MNCKNGTGEYNFYANGTFLLRSIKIVAAPCAFKFLVGIRPRGDGRFVPDTAFRSTAGIAVIQARYGRIVANAKPQLFSAFFIDENIKYKRHDNSARSAAGATAAI